MPVLSRRSLTALTLTTALAIPAAVLVAQGRGTVPQQAAASRVPEPKDVFGFAPGDDYSLASHEQIVEYFRRLAPPRIASSWKRSARAPRGAR